MKTTVTSNGEDVTKKVHLYGPDEKPVNSTAVTPGGDRSPFDNSFLNHVINLLKKHGIAASKIIFMMGTAAATIFGGIVAGANSWEVMLMVWGSGFLLECTFAYSWVMTGSPRLAGRQLVIIRKLFRTASLVMLGDLVCMLLEAQAGLHQLFVTWTSVVQPLAAVYLMWQLYELKGAHPETQAEQEKRDMEARIRALKLRDTINAQRLALAEREHERALEWAALKIRHAHGMQQVMSGWYSRRVKRATKQAIGREVLTLKGKMQNIKGLLGMGSNTETEKMEIKVNMPAPSGDGAASFQ